jgi:hypothetical protein
MFELLTRLLLWALLAYFIWYVLLKLVPQINVKWLLPISLIVLMGMGVAMPNDQGIATAWNIISFPLKPIGLSIVVLIIAFNKGKEKKVPKELQNLLLSVLIILLVFSIPWVSERLEYAMLRSNLNHTEICEDNPNYTAPRRLETLILFLANGVTEPGGAYRPEEQIFQMSDRILQTVEEYRTNFRYIPPEGVLIASRNKPEFQDQRSSEFSLIKEELIKVGVRDFDVYDLRNNSDTFNVKQTSEAISQYIKDAGISNFQIIVIASPMDVGRVKLTLEKTLSEEQQLNLEEDLEDRQFIITPSAWGLSSKFCSEQIQKENRVPDLVDLIPSDSSILRSSRFVDEFFTLSYYYLRDWLEPCWNCWDSVPNSEDSR